MLIAVCSVSANDDLDITDAEGVVFDIASSSEEEEEEAEEEEDFGPGVRRAQSAVSVLDDPGCIAYKECLLKLANVSMSSCRVKGCQQPFTVVHKRVGTCLYLIWVNNFHYVNFK